jgi:hypothetical protein
VRIVGASVAVRDPASVAERWTAVLGGAADVQFLPDDAESGLVEIRLEGDVPRRPVTIGGVRFRRGD